MILILVVGFVAAPRLHAIPSNSFRDGLVALEQNRLRAALRLLSAAESEAPQDARVRNFRGIVLQRLGQVRKAAAEYEQAIRLDPRWVDPYRNWGYLEWTTGSLPDASRLLSEALKIAPDDAYARYYLGRVLLQQKNYRPAFQELEASKVPWPAEPDFLLEAAEGALALRRADQARHFLDRTQGLSLRPAQSVRLGTLLFAANENDRAFAIFSRLYKVSPDARWARFDLALAAERSGQPRESIALARPLAERAHDPDAWSLLGIAYANLKQPEQAISAFRESAKLDPKQESHWLDLTRALMATGDLAQAIAAARKGLNYCPLSYALHLRVGAIELASGHYSQAEAAFRQLIAQGDPLPISSVGLAQVLLRTGRAQEAAEQLRLAEKRIGPNFLLYYFCGIALSRSGHPEEARQQLLEANRVAPDSAEALRWLGAVEMRSNHLPEAIQHLRESLRLAPNNLETRQLLARAYVLAHDPAAAREYARRAESPPLPAPAADQGSDYFVPEWQMPPHTGH